MKRLINWLKSIWRKLANKDDLTIEDWRRLEFRDQKSVHMRENE